MDDDTDDTQADAAALGRVRAELAQLGQDEASAPPVPDAVTSQVVAALRTAGDHHARRSRIRMAAAVGVAAALVAAGLGTVMVLRTPHPTVSVGQTAERITTSVALFRVPLSDQQIIALLDEPASLGALSDPDRLSSCLNGLGYPGSTEVLGARPVDDNGETGVLLVLPATTPDQIAAVFVRSNCSSIDTGLIAATQIRRP